MTTPTKIGMNRTGLQLSPKDAKALQEGVEALMPAAPIPPDGAAIRTRMMYGRDAEAIGTLPPPASMRGVAKTAVEAMKGHKAAVFLDKLGARLAFERTGVRLYDAALVKVETSGSWAGGPSGSELRNFRDEELQHFQLLHEVIEQLGGDPTAVTPAADVEGVISSGVLQVLVDPRMTVAHSLEALLVAELADNEGWEMLISLTGRMGQEELAERFRGALVQEERHLSSVRSWLSRRFEAEATRELEPAHF